MKTNTPIQSVFEDVDELFQELQDDLKLIKGDLANARKCNHETGHLYARLTTIENQIKVLEARRGRIGVKSKHCHPDLTQSQTILATSSVRRKTAEAQVRNTKNQIA